MQYVKTRPVLNVEESDHLSLLPYMFGNDFMLAELQVYALAKKMMPEYEGGFWHFIRLPEGGGYMMPSSGITSPFTRNATPFMPRWTD
ncbi:Putative antirestriction protein (plasmid) [Klebsiella sp. PL-2018]|nr:Putative antirestriction protein [Klebsiella sp. PL-2018]